MGYFENVKKNFGFGCMRLPLLENGEVDIEQFKEMVDLFIESGFNYFDTAHGYLDGKSERALKAALTSRHDRSEYILADKLTTFFFNKKEEVRPFIESQLEICGVDYFDFYLMHAQSESIYAKFKKCEAFEEAYKLKEEGKIKHFGMSFHDRPEILDMILSEHPEIEFVQIQFNYIDYEDPAIQSKKCYEIARKYNKPLIIMEPVRGGNLVNLPEKAKKVLEDLHGGSEASYALRFVNDFDGIFMILSGMSSLDQLKDNISIMSNPKKLTKEEKEAIAKVVDILIETHLIPCTGCRYCVAGCPKKIAIPDLFACMNTTHMYKSWNAGYYYNLHTEHAGKASDCIKCGKCEQACPQHLKIRSLLVDVAKEFEQPQK